MMRMRDENEERYIMSGVFSKIDEEKGERGEGYNAFRREKKRGSGNLARWIAKRF